METYQEEEEPSQAGDPRTAADDKPDLITHVSVGKMNVHDGQSLEPALEDVAARDHKPGQVLADSHYGSSANVRDAAAAGVKLISPAMTPKGELRGDLTLEQFELDDAGMVLRCPTGCPAQSTSRGHSRYQARFDATVCATCPLHDRCLTRTADQHGEGRRWQYTPDRVLHRQRRLSEQSPAFTRQYRWRAGIEATMSRLKYQMRLAHLRVRGMKAVAYTVALRALGLNIRRCSACLAA